MTLHRFNSGGRLYTAPVSMAHWRALLMLVTGGLLSVDVAADPPVVTKPSGAKIKTYTKPNTQPTTPHAHTHESKRPSRIVVVPKTPVTRVKPPQVSGIATPFPNPAIKSYPTKVEVRPALPPAGPVYPLTRFSQFGRTRSPFAVEPSRKHGSAQNFLGIKPSSHGPSSSFVPSTSAITTTNQISSYRPLPKTVVPTHPSGLIIRSGHPERPEKWQKVQDHCLTEWSGWHQKNLAHISSIKGNRMKHWGQVSARYHEPGWAGHFHGKDYRKWRGELSDFRRDRCVEVWGQRKPYWNHVFDQDWWSACWWRSHPPKHVRAAHESPWWWWKSCEPEKIRTFFGVALAVPAVIYDPGATVLYDGSNYYVDGEVSATALAARQWALDLANPEASGIPLPEPAPEGEEETWLPLGVWALVQQQQGDPMMFMQLSVDKGGIVAGAYKNILTGDEQPIVGRVNLQTQRVAWHVGDATQTVYETGLSSLENDVASVFIHFGTDATQTWLLVRIPSPELPPGSVKAPTVD